MFAFVNFSHATLCHKKRKRRKTTTTLLVSQGEKNRKCERSSFHVSVAPRMNESERAQSSLLRVPRLRSSTHVADREAKIMKMMSEILIVRHSNITIMIY